MTDLTGKLISNTYKDLLQVNSSASNGGITTSLTNIQSGNGTNTALKLATNKGQITGTFGVSGNTSIVGGLVISQNVCACAYYGDGSNLTGISASPTGDICVGSASVVGNLYVSGTTSITGATVLHSTATVSGATGFLGTVRVSGATSLEACCCYERYSNCKWGCWISKHSQS
jgi:hypothetical protein